jgi:hypothetical protein
VKCERQELRREIVVPTDRPTFLKEPNIDRFARDLTLKIETC